MNQINISTVIRLNKKRSLVFCEKTLENDILFEITTEFDTCCVLLPLCFYWPYNCSLCFFFYKSVLIHVWPLITAMTVQFCWTKSNRFFLLRFDFFPTDLILRALLLTRDSRGSYDTKKDERRFLLFLLSVIKQTSVTK